MLNSILQSQPNLEIEPISEFIVVTELQRLFLELTQIITIRKSSNASSDRDVEILRCRLFASELQTLESLGKQFGVTRERIRQIGAKLIERFCRAIRAPQLEQSRQIRLLVFRLGHQFANPDELALKATDLLRTVISERHLEAVLLAVFDLELPVENESDLSFDDNSSTRPALVADKIQANSIQPRTTKIWSLAEV